MSTVAVKRRLPWWGKLGLLSFSLALTWGTLELALRIIGTSVPTSTALGVMFQSDSQTGWRGRPDVDTQFVTAEFAARVRHTSEGWRRCGIDSPLADDDASPGRTVWFLGDSFTWGWGVEDDETFVSCLNRMGPTGTRYRNLGIPGYSSVQEYLLLKQLIEQGRRPDVVVVRFCGNDLRDNIWLTDNDPPRPGFSVVNGATVIQGLPVRPSPLWTVSSALRRHSVAAGFLSYHVHRLRHAQRLASSTRASAAPASAATDVAPAANDAALSLLRGGMDAEYPESVSDEDLRTSQQVVFLRDAYARLKELCDQHEIELAIASEFRVHPALAYVCRQLDIRLLDVSRRLERFAQSSDAGQPLYFRHDGHCTPLGHRLIAEALYDELHGEARRSPPRLAEKSATSGSAGAADSTGTAEAIETEGVAETAQRASSIRR